MNKFVKTISVAACVVLSATAAAFAACNKAEEAELTSISLDTANVKTTFTVGESFSAEGLKVKAVYSDETEKIVTNYGLKAYCGDAVVEDGGEFTVAGQYTAKVTYEQKEASYALTVNPAAPADVKVESVTLNQSALSLETGEKATLTATVSPANATNKTVVWSSSDEQVATVKGGEVSALSAGTATITAAAGGKTATCTVTVTLADMRVHVSSAADLENALKKDCDIVLDGNIETAEHFEVEHTVSLDLNGKTVTQTEEKDNALFEVTTSKLTVKGEGTISAKHYVFRVGADPDKEGEIILENGTYTTESASVISVTRGAAQIKGGDYSVTYSGGDKWVVNAYDNNIGETEITVTGGTFHGFNPADKANSDCTVPEDYICKKGEQQDDSNKDVYTVSALETKEASNFTELKQAIADDCRIKLTADITDANERLEINKHIVLDLNGKTLKGTVQEGKGALIWVQEGELYVKGEGTVDSVNGYVFDVGSAKNEKTGKLVIESGTFKSENAASAVQVEKGTAQIKGGEFSVTGDAYNNDYLLNCLDNKDDASIEVTGGRFYKFNPAEADNHDKGASVKTNYVKDGYSSAADGDYYKVTPANGV